MLTAGKTELPIAEVRGDIDTLKGIWKYNITERARNPISYRINALMELVKDDEKYFALQITGLPKRMLKETKRYLQPLITRSMSEKRLEYWDKVYTKEDIHRLLTLHGESNRKLPIEKKRFLI